MKRAAIGLVVAALALGGCNTVNGIGEDISGAARTVQSWF